MTRDWETLYGGPPRAYCVSPCWECLKGRHISCDSNNNIDLDDSRLCDCPHATIPDIEGFEFIQPDGPYVVITS